MSKSKSVSVIRVALFGVFSTDQLTKLLAAGCELHSTDAPQDVSVRESAHLLGCPLLVHPAAWDNLTHPSAKPMVKFDDHGRSREFNSNGGYTRDAVLASSVAAVIVGTGVSPSRSAAIRAAATAAGITVRDLVPVAKVTYATPEQAAATVAELDL